MQKLFQLFNTIWDKSSKYLIGLVIITIPLYPKFPLFNVPGTQVAVRLEDFLIFVVFCVWFLGNAKRMKTFITDPLKRSIVLFWSITLLSTVSAIFLLQTVSPLIALLHWGRRIEYMLLFLFLLDTRLQKKELGFYIKCLVVVFVYAFVFGFGQKYLNWPIITTQNEEYSKGLALRYMEGGHLVSTFAGHYDMASFLILATPLLTVFSFFPNVLFGITSAKKKKIFTIVMLTIAFLGLWLLTNAASRISIISYVGAVSLAFLLARKIFAIPFFVVIVLIVSLMTGSLIGRYENIFDAITKKVHAAEITEVVVSTPAPTPIPPVEDRSTNIRLAVEWPRAIRALKKNPMLGTGFSSISLATDNDYLRSLGETGILGSLAFALCLFLVCMEIVRGYFRERTWSTKKLVAAAMIGALPGIFLNMVFIDLLEASKFAIMFWLFLGLTVAHIRSQNT